MIESTTRPAEPGERCTCGRELAHFADILEEQTAEAAARAMKRYPDHRASRLADEAGQLRMLLEIAVDRMRAMSKECPEYRLRDEETQ